MTSEPLFLKPVLQEKVWGGRYLANYGYELPSDKVGEAWAISAHPHGPSTVIKGAFAGLTLDKLYTEHPELFGNPTSPVFPLLTKILDANDWLSVQVHPDDAYAAAHEAPGELGKTECWYIIAAEPGAELIYGHHAKTREELRAMIEGGDWEHLLRRVPVKAGEFYHVPSGTMHALGAGIVVLETQQSSDTTYRVYDFDRPGLDGKLRELHLQQSIDTLRVPGDDLPENTVRQLTDSVEELVKSEFFNVYKWTIARQTEFTADASYTLVSVLDGTGILKLDGQDYPLKKGDHFILPADAKAWTLDGELTAIASTPA